MKFNIFKLPPLFYLSFMGQVVLFLCLSLSIYAQPDNSFIINHATIHVGNGTVINDGTVEVINGIITYVGTQQKKGTKTYDLSGKHVYPGLILLNSPLGLSEIDAVRATIDLAETGENNANIRSIIAYNTDSDLIPTLRSNGILYAQIAPRGSIICGNSSVVKLQAWNWEDATIKTDEGLHINWPNAYAQQGQEQDKTTEAYQHAITLLTNYFQDLYAYKQSNRIPRNLRLEAGLGILDSTKTLYINADYSKQVIEAIQFCTRFKIGKKVIIGARQAEEAYTLIKEHKIPLILHRIHELPPLPESDIHYVYKLPSMLTKMEIKYALCYDGEMEVMGSRNLPFVAGTTATFGLSDESALQSITLTPAQILGIDKTLGSIENGKKASIIVSEGNVLDMKTSNILMAWIDGVAVNEENKQRDLYQKYLRKYGLK